MKKRITAVFLCFSLVFSLCINFCCQDELETIDEMKNYLQKVDAKATEIEMPTLNVNVKSAV